MDDRIKHARLLSLSNQVLGLSNQAGCFTKARQKSPPINNCDTCSLDAMVILTEEADRCYSKFLILGSLV